jgi:hypothetical protein
MATGLQELERKKGMSEVLILIAVVAGWFVLSRWLLPWMGVPT